MIEISINWFVLWLCISGMVGFLGCLLLVAIFRSGKEERVSVPSVWVDDPNEWWAKDQINKNDQNIWYSVYIPGDKDTRNDTDEEIKILERIRGNYDQFEHE